MFVDRAEDYPLESLYCNSWVYHYQPLQILEVLQRQRSVDASECDILHVAVALIIEIDDAESQLFVRVLL